MVSFLFELFQYGRGVLKQKVFGNSRTVSKEVIKYASNSQGPPKGKQESCEKNSSQEKK